MLSGNSQIIIEGDTTSRIGWCAKFNIEDSEFEETKDDTVICKGCAHPSNWDYGTWDHLVYNSL